jgi:hypothetical protein
VFLNGTPTHSLGAFSCCCSRSPPAVCVGGTAVLVWWGVVGVQLYKKPKIGKLVTQETKSYELVCDMLLGIRVTVSKVSARPLHGNTVKDSDFRVRMLHPPSGGEQCAAGSRHLASRIFLFGLPGYALVCPLISHAASLVDEQRVHNLRFPSTGSTSGVIPTPAHSQRYRVL